MSRTSYDRGRTDDGRRGPNWADSLHDIHAKERGPWEERPQGDPEHLCWVRRPGCPWRIIGIGATEPEAYELFLKHNDLTVSVLVLLANDGDPNDHIVNGGEGAQRIRKRSCDTPKPRLPDNHEDRILYYEKLALLREPLSPSRR